MDRHTTFDWNAIEPRIRPHVKALRDAGYKTTGSCGHDMWIAIDLPAADIPKLHQDMRGLGYRDFEIKHEVHDGFHAWTSTTVQFGGDLKGDEKPFDYVLLKVEPDAHPLYFVVKARTWPDHDATPEHDAYFYGEHTCPTNWTDDIVAVVSQGDCDPHGFATFVRRVTPTPDVDEANDPWLEMFWECREGGNG